MSGPSATRIFLVIRGVDRTATPAFGRMVKNDPGELRRYLLRNATLLGPGKMHTAAARVLRPALEMIGADVFHPGELDAALGLAKPRLAMRPVRRLELEDLEL